MATKDPYADWTVDTTFKPPDPYADWKTDEGYKPPREVGVAEDIARGVGSGIAMTPAKIAGTAGDLTEFAKSHGVTGGTVPSWVPGIGGKKVIDLVPYAPPFAAFTLAKKYLTGSDALPTSEGIKEAIPGYKGLDYEPKTEYGNIGKRTGEFLGSSVLSPARSAAQVGANALRFGLAPAVGSEVAGQGARALAPNAEPLARFAGGFVGSAAATKGISPNASTAPQASRLQHAEHVENVEKALKMKVSPGEKANSTLLRIKEDEANPDHYLKNREAVTSRATADVAPEYSTPVLKPPKIDAAGNITEQGTLGKMREGIGKKFEEVTSNPQNNLELDTHNARTTMTAIGNLLKKYAYSAGYDKDAHDAVLNATNHISQTLAANGMSSRTLPHLTAPQYQTMRSSLMDAAMSAEGQKSKALHDFIDVLDSSFDRSLKTYNPDALGKIQDARRQWRAMLTVEKAAGRADVDHLTPANLEAAAQQNYGKSTHLQGKDPFWWAPSAKAVLRTEANSNTARREQAREALSELLGLPLAVAGYGAGLGIGGGAEHAVGGLLMLEKAAGPAAKMLHPYLDKAAHNPYVQAYSGNQVLAGAPGLLGSRSGPIVASELLRPPEHKDNRQ